MATTIYSFTRTTHPVQVVAMITDAPKLGTIRATKTPDGWLLYMYANDARSFESCISRLLRAKNLRSIAFPKGQFDEHVRRFASLRPSVKTYIVSELPNGNMYDILPYVPKHAIFSRPDMISAIKYIAAKLSEKTETVFPPAKDVFNAFTLTKFPPKVLIVGQDPYHGDDQAMGLAFSVRKGIRPPPSLLNIYKELRDDGFTITDPKCGDLTKWAIQGVLLLNTALTVVKGNPTSHSKLWLEHFTPLVMEYLAKKYPHMVVILWGGHAQSFKHYFENHKTICSAHPSPLSANRGFFGSKPFSTCNEWLDEAMDWSL